MTALEMLERLQASLAHDEDANSADCLNCRIMAIAKKRREERAATAPKEKHEHTPDCVKSCCSCGWKCFWKENISPIPIPNWVHDLNGCTYQHAEHVKEQK